ncbi:MAG: UDP-N-acetylenolpyruvoylglucosamine reductase, partial [Paludibacteraceae bacterium]|nr:UDP-N-acetylenolpyruvoylglucosamine reductase [Paludibacteraceae bacterium]
QPLVLVNYTGKASADEVVALSDTVAADVKAKFGIDIFPEVIFVK